MSPTVQQFSIKYLAPFTSLNCVIHLQHKSFWAIIHLLWCLWLSRPWNTWKTTFSATLVEYVTLVVCFCVRCCREAGVWILQEVSSITDKPIGQDMNGVSDMFLLSIISALYCATHRRYSYYRLPNLALLHFFFCATDYEGRTVSKFTLYWILNIFILTICYMIH